MDEGLDVVTACNGEEALGKLAYTAVTLIISDIYMPAMDGFKLHRVVRSTPGLERLPFLFVSAFDDTHTREAIKDLRCDGFLRTTTPTPELIAWVRFFLIPEEKRARTVPGTSGLTTRTRPRDSLRSGTRTFIS